MQPCKTGDQTYSDASPGLTSKENLYGQRVKYCLVLNLIIFCINTVTFRRFSKNCHTFISFSKNEINCRSNASE